MEKKSLILIGGGMRGKCYTNIGKKLEKFQLIAIAEPIKARRDYLAKVHGVPENMLFESWEPLLKLGKIADAAIIATMDRDHYAPTIAAIDQGYDILLEKPVSPLPEECLAIEKAAKDKGVSVLICHVLRYTPFFRALKNLIREGVIGDVINIQHTEGVGNVHQSHSFVRGNWGNFERSSTMLLQKSCHDIDILQWLIDKECKRVQSFGKLTYFTEKNAPEGSTERCLDGCPYVDSCPYSAKKLYLRDRGDGGWFRNSLTKYHEPVDDSIALKALSETNYGKCVFRCDNNVVDHQVVNMEFEDDITVTFTMSAFNPGGRQIRIMGTKGELIAEASDPVIRYNNIINGTSEDIKIADKVASDSIVQGHGGGDSGIMDAFYDLLSGIKSPELSDISISVKNHMIVFAIEEARLSGKVVDMAEYRAKF